jgi:transposase
MISKIKDILRCYATGMGIKGISSAFEISRNTVRRYVHMFQDSGLSMEQLMSMSEHHLQEMFGSNERERKPSRRETELEALLPDYAARLKRKGVTVKSLYEEYEREHPDGYRHASFGKYLRQYMLGTRVIGHVEHYAGDQMYIDFAGDKLEVVDAETGEVRGVEVFVAILPCSHYTYCEAVWSQQKGDLIKACENALHFYGGAPLAIVPDNLKSAVIRNNRNEPVINEEFAAFAEHYGCAVYPARVRHPKDKALVENAVKLMYRSVYADIEGLVFHDLDSLNAAIRNSLDVFNGRKMSNRKESRRELFEQVEKGYLRPLPERRHQMKQRLSATVMRNSYVTLFKHHYSVPKEYVGKRVDLVFDADTVEIFHGLKLVTAHQRNDTPYEYTQKEAHHLPGRHGSYEKDIEEIYGRAAQIDNILLLYLKEVASLKKYPPLAFRSCRGILSLEKKYGIERLVAACACATQSRRYGYNDILDILEKGDDADFMPSADTNSSNEASHSLPQHKNIRGRDYYTKPATSNKKSNKNGNKH